MKIEKIQMKLLFLYKFFNYLFLDILKEVIIMQKNKLSIKQILLLFLIIVSLLGLLKPVTVQAAEGSGWLGNAIGDADAMNNGNSGGPSFIRTGWAIMLCDETSTPVLGSKVVFFPYMNNPTFAACGGAITTSYTNHNMNAIAGGTPLNAIPAFNGCVPGGPLVKSWLMTDYTDETYENNACYVIENYLGVPYADVMKELANGKQLYVQFTPIFWCRTQGLTKASQGPWYIGNAYNWAAQNGFPSYIKVATHRNFPQKDQ